MSENEIETLPVRQPSWRDNKAVLWLVRIGFLLQFYIPAIVCILIMWDASLPPQTVNNDEIFYKNLLHTASLITLILLVVQGSIFTLILRFAKLRTAKTVLWWLVVINILHTCAWGIIVMPVTLIRLTPPTILYLIAIRIESKTLRHAEAGVQDARCN